MKNLSRGFKVAALLAAVAMCVGLAPTAQAAGADSMLLCISDTDFGCVGGAGNNVTVHWTSGGGLSDTTQGNGTFLITPILSGSPTNGVTVDATLGVFSFNLDTGTFMGPGNAMDFNIDNIASTGPGNLFLVFGAGNYSGGAPFHLNGSATLPSGASETDTACLEEGVPSYFICGGVNSPVIGTATTSSTGALTFNSSVTPTSTPFGLEQDVEISFTGAGQVSGDLQLVAAPEPASIVLFSVVALAAFLTIRRKMQLS